MNPTTRKHPRTLTEAFGPYAGRSIHEPVDPMDRADKIVIAGSLVALVALIAVSLFL